MKKYDVYLFDFDGTLVDSKDSLYDVFKGAYKAVGVDVNEDHIIRLMRIQLQQGYKELGAPEDEEHIKIFGDEIIRLLDDEEVLKKTKIYLDTKETLYKLYEEGKTLGIVTSNNVKHVSDVLRFLDIDKNIFKVIVGNFETKRHKPFPDPILKALEMLDISEKGVCYVGDGLDDMRSATAAKVTPILLDRIKEYDNESYDKIYSLIELL